MEQMNTLYRILDTSDKSELGKYFDSRIKISKDDVLTNLESLYKGREPSPYLASVEGIVFFNANNAMVTRYVDCPDKSFVDNLPLLTEDDLKKGMFETTGYYFIKITLLGGAVADIEIVSAQKEFDLKWIPVNGNNKGQLIPNRNITIEFTAIQDYSDSQAAKELADKILARITTEHPEVAKYLSSFKK